MPQQYMNRNNRARARNGGYANKPKEADVIRAADMFLTLKKIPHWRNNTGAYKERGRFIRYGRKGSSDFIGICGDGRFLAVECKRPSGGVLSAAQREFLDMVNRHGGIGIVVNSIESLELQLREAGVI